MDDNIGGVEDFIQFTPNSAGGTFVVNGFASSGCGRMVDIGIINCEFSICSSETASGY